MSRKMFRKIYHSGLEMPLYWPNFSKKVRRLTDQQEKSGNILGQNKSHKTGWGLRVSIYALQTPSLSRGD